MDALKGIGHACGHNLIGISGWPFQVINTQKYLNCKLGVAVACAIKAALEQHNLSGKIVLLGTPGNALTLDHWLRSQLIF